MLHCRNSQTGQTKENMVFCTDILDIVTKDFFSRKSKSRQNDPIDPAGHSVQEVVSQPIM